MLAWYFIFTVILLMVIILFLSKDGNKTFSGLKDYIPQFKTEVGQELTPQDRRKQKAGKNFW